MPKPGKPVTTPAEPGNAQIDEISDVLASGGVESEDPLGDVTTPVEPVEPTTTEPVEPITTEPAEPTTTPVEPAVEPTEPPAVDLSKQIADGIAKSMQPLLDAMAQQQTAAQQANAPAAPEITLPEQPFFTDGDYEVAMGTKDGSEFLQQTVYNAVNYAYQQAMGKLSAVMDGVPNAVAPIVNQMYEVKEMSKRFYAENEHLNGVKDYVKTAFLEEQKNHPNLKYEEILFGDGAAYAGLAAVVNKRLKIEPKAPGTTTTPNPKPGGAPPVPKPSGRKTTPAGEPTGLQAEIDKTLGFN